MKHYLKNNGFTLIELLVVVLIVGILSAIALPQYTKAVAKSRAAEGVIQGKAFLNTIKTWQMENGGIAINMSGIDSELPSGWSCPGNGYCLRRFEKAGVLFEVNNYFSAPALFCISNAALGHYVCSSYGTFHHEGSRDDGGQSSYYLITK